MPRKHTETTGAGRIRDIEAFPTKHRQVAAHGRLKKEQHGHAGHVASKAGHHKDVKGHVKEVHHPQRSHHLHSAHLHSAGHGQMAGHQKHAQGHFAGGKHGTRHYHRGVDSDEGPRRFKKARRS